MRSVRPGTDTTVDVAQAIREGKRRRRTRNALSAVAAAVVVCVVVTVSSWALRDRAPEPATTLDPLRQAVSAGSAGGFTPVAYRTAADRQEIALGLADHPDTPGGAVTLYPAGGHPGQTGPDWRPAGDPAPDVAGRAAVWSGTDVVWEWADRAWAVVRLDAAFPDLRDRAHRVAQSVVADGRPVTVPFTLDPDVPVRLVAVRVPVRSTGSPAAGELAAVELARGGATVVVGLRSDALPGRDLPADALVAGRPAAVTGDGVTVLDPGGRYGVRVAVGHGDAVAAFGGIAGLSALAATAVPVPDPADRRSWTPDPLVG
ncbi:hypothetical protein ABZ816_01695 [Actinosynnema sp. NPDC047251]|uniref:hypothetical protein n=1 Tax=Saccharothrix espanaensis TaxID=103731 RepID=UPI001E5B1F53|nr:hypothetical protein [Saccharothrix espanaensis]